ncbi:hypothetical protein ACFL0X_01850 [Nanoarchaeota archaeon]
MKKDTLIYGQELLTILSEIDEDIELPDLEQKTRIKGDELKELLKYLHQKKYLSYRLGLFVNTSKISESTIKILPNGMEVVFGKRDYFNDVSSQTIHNQTNVSNSSEFQVAQNIGDHSPISQTQDNSKVSILKQLIDTDGELEEPKKKKLFEILEKFNTIKQSGENAYELIKQVGSIAVKYVPMFFSLL